MIVTIINEAQFCYNFSYYRYRGGCHKKLLFIAENTESLRLAVNRYFKHIGFWCRDNDDNIDYYGWLNSMDTETIDLLRGNDSCAMLNMECDSLDSLYSIMSQHKDCETIDTTAFDRIIQPWMLEALIYNLLGHPALPTFLERLKTGGANLGDVELCLNASAIIDLMRLNPEFVLPQVGALSLNVTPAYFSHPNRPEYDIRSIIPDSVKVLHLNLMFGEDANILGRDLVQLISKNVTTLDFRNNPINVERVIELLEVLPEHVCELNLSNTQLRKLTLGDLRRLYKVVGDNKISTMNLSHNNLGYMSSDCLEETLKNPGAHVAHLDLGYNYLEHHQELPFQELAPSVGTLRLGGNALSLRVKVYRRENFGRDSEYYTLEQTLAGLPPTVTCLDLGPDSSEWPTLMRALPSTITCLDFRMEGLGNINDVTFQRLIRNIPNSITDMILGDGFSTEQLMTIFTILEGKRKEEMEEEGTEEVKEELGQEDNADNADNDMDVRISLLFQTLLIVVNQYKEKPQTDDTADRGKKVEHPRIYNDVEMVSIDAAMGQFRSLCDVYHAKVPIAFQTAFTALKKASEQQEARGLGLPPGFPSGATAPRSGTGHGPG
jgi:hypothetical protein